MRSELVKRALVSGTLAALAVTLAASLAGRQDEYSVKYTGVGFSANYGASVFWALFYEALGKKRSAKRALLHDVVPRRLTPGFELRLARPALALVYAALALGLSLRDLCSSTFFSPPTAPGSPRKA